jgi:hypothetical protein
MRTTLVAILAILALAGVARAQTEKGADLEAYIADIRASGVSETGRSHLRSVAGVCCGATILAYRKDEASGQYWASYTSATCPKPATDTAGIEQWKVLQRSKADELTSQLKPFADADGSGFVTTQEASDFRFLMEYGYLVAQVIRDEGPSIDLVARASGMDVDAAMHRIEAYKVLAQRIDEAGIAELPDVTLADAGSSAE